MKLQGAVQRTDLVRGSAPNWNKHLTLPYKLPEGLASASEMRHCQDAIVISLYDEARRPPARPPA